MREHCVFAGEKKLPPKNFHIVKFSVVHSRRQKRLNVVKQVLFKLLLLVTRRGLIKMSKEKNTKQSSPTAVGFHVRIVNRFVRKDYFQSSEFLNDQADLISHGYAAEFFN